MAEIKKNQLVEEPVRSDRALKGVDVIKGYLKTLPSDPGVYRMINNEGDVLYVGESQEFKKKGVQLYQSGSPEHPHPADDQSDPVYGICYHTYRSRGAAARGKPLKKLTPRYNILLRDDKTFPYILITGDHAYPQVLKYRGTRKRKGEYFGPFASAGAVNQSLAILQRAFLLRSCTDAVFTSRTRPCLLYQIKRCSAPCVEITTREAYARLVEQARSFLTGRSKTIQKQLAEEMQDLSENLQFEKAAVLRDRIKAMTNIQSHQDIQAPNIDEADIIALHMEAGQACIQIFFFACRHKLWKPGLFPSPHGRCTARTDHGSFLRSVLCKQNTAETNTTQH